MEKLKHSKYDLIVGIGQNCLSAEILRELGLVDYTTPFDWVQIYGYATAINILKNKFQNFFRKEDLSFRCVDKNDNSSVFYNKRTKIVYVHDFGVNGHENFDVMYDKVNAKLQRRILRILNKLSNNKKICLIYIEYANLKKKNVKINNDMILKDIEDLEKIYKNKFDIFYIKHNPKLKLDEYIPDNKICEMNNAILEGDGREYLGNKAMVSNIISQRIGLNFRKKFKKTEIGRFLDRLFLVIKIQFM